MENNSPSSNSGNKQYGTFITGILLVVVTASLVYYASVQSQFMEKQTESLKNQAVSLEKQTESLKLQTIAIQNNPANQPKLTGMSTFLKDGSIDLSLSNEGATIHNLKASETSWVRAIHEHGKKDFPVSITCSKHEVICEENRGDIKLFFKNQFNFANILDTCDKSKKMQLVQFLVIRISYDDMFNKHYNKYYRLVGKEYPPKESNQEKKAEPSKRKNPSRNDTGWYDSGWDIYDGVVSLHTDREWDSPTWVNESNKFGYGSSIFRQEGEFWFEKYEEGSLCGEGDMGSYISKVNLNIKPLPE